MKSFIEAATELAKFGLEGGASPQDVREKLEEALADIYGKYHSPIDGNDARTLQIIGDARKMN